MNGVCDTSRRVIHFTTFPNKPIGRGAPRGGYIVWPQPGAYCGERQHNVEIMPLVTDNCNMVSCKACLRKLGNGSNLKEKYAHI